MERPLMVMKSGKEKKEFGIGKPAWLRFLSAAA
jgi:hypothetical protein